MRLSRRNLFGFAAAMLAALSLQTLPANAQFGGGGGGLGGGGGGLGGGGGGLGGGGLGGGNAASGVVVDADGVVHRNVVADPGGRVTRQRLAQAAAQLAGDLSKPSKLRKVSLTRLERAVQAQLDAGGSASEAMKRLAGLTRIDYVFCYPETGDLVVAGPAEPWAEDVSGRVRGVNSGRPVLQLEDLITALRAFPPRGEANPGDEPLLYCSIDPTPEGLSRMQRFLAKTHFRRPPNQRETQFFVEQLRDQLGLQVITVGGIPASTHFAQVMVEADYRMKLIGIGLEQPPVRLASYVSRANPGQVSRNAMQRWYFVPEYECLRVSDDGLGMEIVGEGVKLIGEDELVSRDGGRRSAGRSNRASSAFVKAFTKVYSKLADRSPVYAELRNCIDLAVAAAFMQDRDLYGKAEWTMPVFGSEEAYPVETYNAPTQVATAVNSLWKGSTLMTPIGGGVEIRPTWALQPSNLLDDEKGKVYATRLETAAPEAGERWWWD